jgi:Rps23 Pro-64 3,4-dihydroxylase Tpa1-like proline 4-hydroxylase
MKDQRETLQLVYIFSKHFQKSKSNLNLLYRNERGQLNNYGHGCTRMNYRAWSCFAVAAVLIPAKAFLFPRLRPSNLVTMVNVQKVKFTTAVAAADFDRQGQLLSDEAYNTILEGRIAVVPNFLPSRFIQELRADAQNLHGDGHFTTDALASYGSNGNFDPSKDRAVLKLQQWKDVNLGNIRVRADFGATMARLRQDLSENLRRPDLAQPDSAAVAKYGNGSTEISYTRFGPGAFLKRHVDEHHEELKAAAGWSKPTRRSISWLIYLNEEWDGDKDGGQLRCFERRTRMARGTTVGSRQGDLQIGWLRATTSDPVERPVFLDARRNNPDGNVAMYVDAVNGGQQYISKLFHSHPILYMSGGEYLTQKLLMQSPEVAVRFHFIEPPKSKISDWLAQSPGFDEQVLDVDPKAGTLVLFDSVALPHEVLATRRRDRWATSGWMHEDQQTVYGASEDALPRAALT